MKRPAFLAVVACLCAGALTGTGRADIITFGSANIDPLTGSHTEGAFTYQVVSGSVWAVSSGVGNPPSALSTGDITRPQLGDEIDFFLTGGGLFAFDSFDFAQLDVPALGSDGVNFIGEVAGTTTQQLLGFNTTDPFFQTRSPGFSAPIDTLRIIVVSLGEVELDLDNFVFTPVPTAVPEPASLTLLGLGAAGLAGYGWRRKRAA